jgi:pyridoxine 5-phosphate synthase
MATLAVNVDHIATLRQARGVTYPDPVTAAGLAELAGARGIVVHLREDRRHIQDRDVRILRETVQTKLILEMAATPEMIGIATEIKPDLVTLVPEKREELTTEGGLDLLTNEHQVATAVATLKEAGIPTSIFVDPAPAQIKLAHQIDAAKVEIHTGTYCDAPGPEARAQAFAAIVDAVKLAFRLKLGINAGHGLCYNTIEAFRELPEIDEFSIGHSIISKAALVGMDRAVREMVALVEGLAR